MSVGAEDLGRRLLDEVEEVDLSEILTSDKALHENRPLRSFGVAALDELADVFQPAHRNQPVVQIDSATDNEGAAALLQHAIASSVLPASSEGGRRAGLGGAAILFDLDGRFDVEMLEQSMHQYLSASGTVRDAEEQSLSSEQIIEHALKHVHIFRPQSMASLVETLRNVDRYLFSFKTHVSGDRAISLLAFNNIGAFYWQDRAREEFARFDAASNDEQQEPKQPGFYWGLLANAVREFQANFNAPALATNWGLIALPKTRENAPPSFKPHLPGVWQNSVTLRLVTERETVKKFADNMTLEMVAKEADMRLAVVRQGRWGVWVDSWGSESWSDVIMRRLRSRASRGFIFYVREDGTAMEAEMAQ